jgi:hypothetical protein
MGWEKYYDTMVGVSICPHSTLSLRGKGRVRGDYRFSSKFNLQFFWKHLSIDFLSLFYVHLGS